MRINYRTIVLIIVVSMLFYMGSCTHSKKQPVQTSGYKVIDGYTQSTTYHIIYECMDGEDYKREIDSLLEMFTKVASIYDTSSLISKINNSNPDVTVNQMFKDIFNRAIEVSESTDGLFDITVGPLVNAWGFGPYAYGNVSPEMIDSLLKYVGYSMVKLEGEKIIKKYPEIKLDFNAIAQGYSVDLIARFLTAKGSKNFLTEIGGEVYCKGLKSADKAWRIGIDKPVEGSQVAGQNIQVVLELSNRALATSGNYRKFYRKDGVKYSHTINPKTGYPVSHNLLSATVIADDCMSADAFATAFMVMGLDKSKEFLITHPELEALFIYADTSIDYAVYYTPGVDSMLSTD